MSRIDAHHHLWDLRVRPQDWMTPELEAVIGGPYTSDDWDAAAGPASVGAGVFVQTVADPAETPEILALAQAEPRLAAVVGWIDVEQGARGAGELLDELRSGTGGELLAGIRVAAEYHPDAEWLDTPGVHAAAVALAERDLALDLLTKPANLAAAERLAAAHPETRMVLNHLSKPTMRKADFPAWAAGVRALGKHAGVACKLSGYLTFDGEPLTAARLRPYTDVIFEAFGPERVMFGSDWPVSVLGGGYSVAVDIAEQILAPLTGAERACVWAATAMRWYPVLAVER